MLPLADALPTEPNATTMGMVVIICIQLAGFIFAWRKDARGSEAAKKEDLKTLKTELRAEIDEHAAELKAARADFERKLEGFRKEADRSRRELHEKINEVSLKTSTLIKGQEITEQTLNHLATKIDAMRHKLTA
jgi:uncharacterized protein YlxW (UPF0749 family)